MAKFLKIDPVDRSGASFIFYCPGCEMHHGVWTKDNPNHKGAKWEFNGDVDKPTVSPSLLVNPGGVNPTQPICHSFITDGKIQYLKDCTHALAGQTVELTEVEQ